MMMRNCFSLLAVGGLVGLGLTGAAVAQEFRDSRTGKTWTPDLVQESVATANPNAPVNGRSTRAPRARWFPASSCSILMPS